LLMNPAILTFYNFPPSIRRTIYSTNLIEGFNKQLKKYTKRKEQFPNEESLARLLTFSAFLKMFKTKKYTLVWASIASSCLFGLLHLSNLTMQSFNTTMQQIFYATVLGLCFSVIRIRFNGLSYVVLLHFLIDFQPTIANGAATSSSWGEILLILMPIAIVSIICLILLNKDNKSLELLV
ncbi:transposase, partial [Enterococcus faecium]|uniref:CPBP family intramembrane glutamic endopeptidase n=1 Tax=Enterococcus faecium TaxID=1352 RepID=UPI00155FF39A|nr:transposase [Enterococcus faecium]